MSNTSFRSGSSLFYQDTQMSTAVKFGLKFMLFSLLISVVVSACTNAPTKPEQASKSEQDAVLARLAELQNEIKSLQAEVREIHQSVDDIHRVAVRPAPKPVTKVSLDESPILGSNDAKVAIVEFSDYQCPFCYRFFSQSLQKLKQQYIDTGKVKLVFRNFPLSIHPQAKSAAVAAQCAGKQDAYWKMHDALFSNQRRLGPPLYQELAEKLKLDTKVFQECTRDNAQVSKAINVDFVYGESLGVSGTPTFFVGRVQDGQIVDVKQIVGAQPYQVFAQALDALLR
jgi:protein-disulfide isomerase